MFEQVCHICKSYMKIDQPLNGWLKCPSCGFCKKKIDSMITIEEILMGRIKFDELSIDLQINLADLLKKLNKFRQLYGKPMIVTSGYRPSNINSSIGGAKKSAHLECQACDFKDTDGKLKEFILKNIDILEQCDLYLEDPDYTKGWVHLQSRKTSSGKRIFKP